MTNRERFINYIKNGEGKFICSPQIGAGAGFDTKLADLRAANANLRCCKQQPSSN